MSRHRTHVALQGLEARGAQVWRGVRLVPLVRTTAPPKLRLARTDVHAPTITTVDPHPSHPSRSEHYLAVIPHAYVLAWGDDAEAELSLGGRFTRDEGRVVNREHNVQMRLRMVRRASERSLRFLPQHLAIEGLLALYFGGPSIATHDWSERVLRAGFDPRVERALSGRAMPDLADALRVFEIVEGQCGMLLFSHDTLLGAFVAPTADDYRACHDDLVYDLFPAEIAACARYDAPVFHARIEGSPRTLGDVRRALDDERGRWDAFYRDVARDLLREADAETVWRAEGFTLERFLTHLRRKGEHHAGERVTTRDGTLAYLKTYRLSTAQGRRVWALDALARADWNLARAATLAKLTLPQFVDDLCRVGFAWMLHPRVFEALRRR